MIENSLHKEYLQEIDKIRAIAKMQLNAEIIKRNEYRAILFLCIDKLDIYIDNVEKIKVPEINIANYKNIDLFQLTNVLFSNG